MKLYLKDQVRTHFGFKLGSTLAEREYNIDLGSRLLTDFLFTYEVTICGFCVKMTNCKALIQVFDSVDTKDNLMGNPLIYKAIAASYFKDQSTLAARFPNHFQLHLPAEQPVGIVATACLGLTIVSYIPHLTKFLTVSGFRYITALMK